MLSYATACLRILEGAVKESVCHRSAAWRAMASTRALQAVWARACSSSVVTAVFYTTAIIVLQGLSLPVAGIHVFRWGMLLCSGAVALGAALEHAMRDQ